MRRRTKIILSILGIIFAITLGGFVIWAETPLGPLPEVNTVLKSDSSVDFANKHGLTFTPHGVYPTTGLIIYPGGRVDYRSYAPLAYKIASRGYLVIIARMPFNLAVFNANAASNIIAHYPEIKVWTIGGHSLGGTMAAQFAYYHPLVIRGLALWAAYPASGTDLSNSDIKVLTIRGTNDGLVSAIQIDESLARLPQDTISVEIVGGNHAQFGFYGNQPGDHEATISRDRQQSLINEAMSRLLENVSQNNN